MKRLVCAASCLVLLAWLGVARAAEDGERLVIGWVYAMANAPILVAEEKGYFRDEGLAVEILPFTSGPLVHQALVAGELDVAYIGAAPVYHWHARGLDSRILAKVNYGQAAVLARADGPVRSLADLKGARMGGVRKGSGMDVLLRGFVLGEVARLVPDRDVQIVAMSVSNMGPALEKGLIDAAFMWEPFTSQFLLRGHSRVVLDMNQAEPRYPWYVVMALQQTLGTKRPAIARVLRAHRRAVDFLNSAPNAGTELIARAFRLGEVADATGRKHAGTEVVAAARARLGWEWDFSDADRRFIQRMMNYSYQLGYLKKELRVDELVDTSLVREVAP